MVDVSLLSATYEAGQYAEVWALYRENWQSADAECHYWAALSAWRLHKPAKGRDVAKRGLSKRPKGDTLLKLRYVYGICARETGDVIIAVEQFDEVLKLLEKRSSPLASVFKGPALYNKALALWQTGGHRHLEAVAVYGHALAEFGDDYPEFRRMTLQNSAWALVAVGDYREAATMLDLAEPLCDTDNARAVQKVTRAYRFAMTGEVLEAHGICEQLLADERVGADIKCLAAGVCAHILIGQGDLKHAELAAKHAYDLGLAVFDQRCLRFAIDAQWQVSQQKVRHGAS